jgi:Mg/Co/Ni transporter MgtE
LKRNIIIGFLFFIVFLVGCSREQIFEDFFQQKMKEMHKGEKNYSYSLLHTELNAVHEGDAIAVFNEHNNQGEQIFIAYFEKENNQWEWKQTRGAEWNTLINVEDDKRFWYAISPIKDVKVKTVKEDGTEEVIEEINHEELQSK